MNQNTAQSLNTDVEIVEFDKTSSPDFLGGGDLWKISCQ